MKIEKNLEELIKKYQEEKKLLANQITLSIEYNKLINKQKINMVELNDKMHKLNEKIKQLNEIIEREKIVKKEKDKQTETQKCEFKKKIEQVPETFEELKELCKELKERLNKNIWEIKIEEDVIHVRRIWETKEICFTNTGNMFSNNGWDLLMTNLTPVRQWQIIKSLIGGK